MGQRFQPGSLGFIGKYDTRNGLAINRAVLTQNGRAPPMDEGIFNFFIFKLLTV